MTRQLLHRLSRWLLLPLLLALTLTSWQAHAAEGIEITEAHIESTDEGYKLSVDIAFELTRGLENVIMRGIPLYFTTEVELTRPRWYWFDEKAVTASRTVRISYNVLTHQYHASASSGLQQSFSTLDDALSLIRRPGRWLIAEPGALKPGNTYQVAVRMGLDIARLPKPFQVHALNSSDWRFSSDWKRFTFKVE